MSLNWKEIALILHEVDLTGSKIQCVIQNSFHSITWEMYSRERGRFSYYTEVGTDESRLHIISSSKPLQKTRKLQRFVQFARKNIEGSVITNVVQLPFDRCVIWELNNHDRILKIFVRLYSGPGANIIVTDQNNKILDLLLRRPNRDETSGEILGIEERKEEGKIFEVRSYEGSFNEFIEKTCSLHQSEDLYANLLKQVQTRKEHEIARIQGSIRSIENTINANKEFEELKYSADLLSTAKHLIKHGDSFIVVKDWNRNCYVTISINRSLNPGANVKAYYDKYQKAKGTYINAVEEKAKLENELESIKSRFDKALDPSSDRDADIKKLKAILDKTSNAVQVHEGPGIHCTSGGFEIIAGRNAKENDELLRHTAKPNDMWLHTRDFPGGYVFIRYKRNKTIPLDVLLDAANLAVLFSKAKNVNKVDLYYTEVRYLRRAKNGKTGLVLPTQEKNLTITLDRKRIEKLLPDSDKIIDETDNN